MIQHKYQNILNKKFENSKFEILLKAFEIILKAFENG